MEARFLECMAAIALHSNIPLPIGDKNEDKGQNEREKESCGTADAIEQSDGTEASTSPLHYSVPNEMSENKGLPKVTLKNYERRTWPNTAIDEELCQELENYKNLDVPVIQAFVIPSRSPNSSAIKSDEKRDTSPSVPSVAVPLPVLNILLDRILRTMLE